MDSHCREGRSIGSIIIALVVVGSLAVMTTGCSVHAHKDGQAENVHLHIPLGALDVRTNAIHGPDVGLPLYPGAVEVGEHGDDSGSADINMSFGPWSIHIKAIGYRSNDPEEKIIGFYKKALAEYGDVLTCKGKVAIGEPSRTRQGLTCENDHEYNVNLRLDTSKDTVQVTSQPISGDVKLLAGSPENQHFVDITPEQNGTKFSVVVVRLPDKHRTD
jgi:hypothetical protein